MEPALALTIVIASMLSLVLAGDTVVRLVRWVSSVSLVPRRLRLAAAAVVVLVAGAGTLRIPASATTPPPAVRLGTVDESASGRPDHPDPRPPTERYIVEPGDSLWRIARSVLTADGSTAGSAEVGVYWRAIYAANRHVIGDDPNLIHPGQELELPRR